MFTKINNYNEYKKFVESVKEEFECIEDWEYFFGFNLKWNEETGEVLETMEEYEGDIEYKPEKYPCIIYSLFKSERLNIRDRDETKMQIVDWCYIEEL